jgi:REP element-mobilizing transposase RayT
MCTTLLMSPQPPAPNRARQQAGPASYLITFVCYGTRLHGDEGAIDRNHNLPGGRTLPADRVLLAQSEGLMKHPPYRLDAPHRAAVLRGVKSACQRRNWSLLANHVRTNHFMQCFRPNSSPERVMNALKAYASHALNLAGLDTSDRPRWARHGSTRYLWTREQVSNAIRYVVAGQGDQMAVYCHAS